MADNKKKLNQQDKAVTPKKRRVSQKQRDAIDLENKKKQYAEDYKEYLENRDNLRLSKDLHRITEARYIERKLKEETFKMPRGIYQEPQGVGRDYKLRFLQALRQTSPHIFEELRPIGSNFKVLFGQTINAATEHDMIDQINDCLEFLKKLENNIYLAVDSSLLISEPITEVQEDDHPLWRTIILPLFLLKNSDKLSNITKISVPNNEVSVWLNKEGKDSIAAKQMPDLLKTVEETIACFFQKNTENREKILDGYLTMQCFLYEWMNKYHLEKEWILKSAYSILFQFAMDGDLPLENLELPVELGIRELQAAEFNFKAEGWWAGGMSAKEYEKFILAEVKKTLPRYFHNAYNSLKLEKRTEVTKAKDPTYKSIYFLVAWNEGATNPQIAESFSEFYSRKPFGDIIKDATRGLETYDLPKRLDKPGRKSSSPISNERLATIKNALIKSIEKDITSNTKDKPSLKKVLDTIKRNRENGGNFK